MNPQLSQRRRARVRGQQEAPAGQWDLWRLALGSRPFLGQSLGCLPPQGPRPSLTGGGDSLPARPSVPSCPTGVQGGSSQPRSQKGQEGSSWGTEPAGQPLAPTCLSVRPDGAGGGLRDSLPLCSGPRDSHKSSIKLKVPHLNSNRKGQEVGGFAEPPAPPPTAAAHSGDCPLAESRPRQGPEAPQGRWGTQREGFPLATQPRLLVAFPGTPLNRVTCHRKRSYCADSR